MRLFKGVQGVIAAVIHVDVEHHQPRDRPRDDGDVGVPAFPPAMQTGLISPSRLVRRPIDPWVLAGIPAGGSPTGAHAIIHGMCWYNGKAASGVRQSSRSNKTPSDRFMFSWFTFGHSFVNISLCDCSLVLSVQQGHSLHVSVYKILNQGETAGGLIEAGMPHTFAYSSVSCWAFSHAASCHHAPNTSPQSRHSRCGTSPKCAPHSSQRTSSCSSSSGPSHSGQ